MSYCSEDSACHGSLVDWSRSGSHASPIRLIQPYCRHGAPMSSDAKFMNMDAPRVSSATRPGECTWRMEASTSAPLVVKENPFLLQAYVTPDLFGVLKTKQIYIVPAQNINHICIYYGIKTTTTY